MTPKTTTKRTPVEQEQHKCRSGIRAIKEAISIEDYLRTTQGVELRHGRGRCVVHRGDNPTSFSVDTEKQLWHCFSCGRGGDLIDLCELVEQHCDLWTAVVSLSIQFGVELPRKPDGWHRWQGEKSQVREVAKRHIAGVYQRRLTRLYAPLILIGGETSEEELEELEELAAALWPISLSMAGRRVAGE